MAIAENQAVSILLLSVAMPGSVYSVDLSSSRSHQGRPDQQLEATAAWGTARATVLVRVLYSTCPSTNT